MKQVTNNGRGAAVLMGLDRLKWVQVAAMVIIVAGMVLTNAGKRRRAKADATS